MSLLLNRNSSSNTSYTVAFRKAREHQAIEIDPPEEAEYDVEAGFNSSTCHLMHNFEEERPTSLVASLRESAKSSKRKVKYYCSFIFTPIRKLLATFKLLIIIGLYSFAGAHLFMYLEVPTDLEAKEDGYHQRKIAREVMVLNLRAIHYDNREDREERWKHAILKFEADMGLDEPVIETAWTFWMSFLYAGTIFTTIGYGNIACKTRAGQVATMIYAFAGIPIMLVMLSSLNNFLLKWIKTITNGICDMLLYMGVRLGLAVIRQDEVQKRLRYTRIAKKMAEWRLAKQVGSIAISSSEENRLNSSPEDQEDEEEEPDPPVFSTLFATVSWIMLSAGVFCLFEDWTFFTSFYFCFISLTTIGLGDVTPANPEYMIATFGVVIVGLSMLTVCIDVIKEKLALMYMALLQKLLKDYMEAVKSGDPNAASAMMAGFQGKAKFLMPLISKNEGAKVMSKFKQDCSKKGIDPPPVLTNINPETGMPAFANASRQDFNDYIEVAEEKFAEEQQQRLTTQTPLSKSSDFLQPASRKASISIGVTHVSSEVQAGTTMGKFHDYGSQTQNESSDEGIQTDYSLDFALEKSTTEQNRQMADAETQYDLIVQMNIGIQPEVSSIYIDFDEHSSAEDEESGCESEAENFSEDEENLPFEVDDPGVVAFGLKSPPIEITPFTDDESAASESRSSPVKSSPPLMKLTPTKVEKSASMDSADTVIHVEPKEEEEESAKRRTKKKKRKTLKTKKAREHELRFLKNSGNQTSPILLDCATQYEVFTSDTSCQYDLKGRSRKCQTKLSSINHEQLQGIRETVQKLRRRESEMSRLTVTSESDWEEVAEVSLDLEMVALGVNESGKVVEVPQSSKDSSSPSPKRKSSGDSPLESERMEDEDDIESLEELEMFSTDTGVQTEQKVMVSREAHTTPRALEIIRNSTTQTTFSTFHLPQKVYESASTSSEEEDDKETEPRVQKSKSEVFFMTNSAVQTTQTSFHLEESSEREVVVEAEDVPLFLRDSGCQTMDTEVVRLEEAVGKLESSEAVVQTERASVEDGECQTESSESSESPETRATESFPTCVPVHCQTDEEEPSRPETLTAVSQTDTPLTSEVHTQVSLDPVERRTDTVFQEQAQVQTELETSTNESQTERIGVDHSEMQTDQMNTSAMESQTERVVVDHIETQTDQMDTSTTEAQTDRILVDHIEMQTDQVDSSTAEAQTERISVDHSEMQTDQIDLLKVDSSTAEAQTESIGVDHSEMQTDQNEGVSTESQTEKMDLTDTNMQTDENTLLTADSQTDAIATELQYTQTDETENAPVPGMDAFTQYEPTNLTSSETQYTTTSLEDVTVQATPISVDTHTQHSIENDAKSCQTEIVVKRNKRSQEEDEPLWIDNECQIEVDRSSVNLSPIRIDVSHTFTMTEPSASEEKEVQVDEESFEEDVPPYQHDSGPLWSDFDYTPVFGEDDEEVMDGETQTEDGSEPGAADAAEEEEAQMREHDSAGNTDEFAVQCAPESSDVKTQTVRFKRRNEEKNVEARVEMSTSTVQATTEMCEQSAGSLGDDDWLQVYVQELDEERRLRMSDIGIQTGVLARVQHMYTRPISDDVNATSSASITLRKSSDSSEDIPAKVTKSSEESLATSGPITAAESMDDRLWTERASPFASRHGSMKKKRRGIQETEKKTDKTNIVQDLRAKFEMKSPPKSPRDDGEEGASSSSKKHFF